MKLSWRVWARSHLDEPTAIRQEGRMKMETSSCVRLPVVSFFSGMGGLDLGFSLEGFDTVAAFDNNASAVETFNANHSNRPGHVLDLREADCATVANLVPETSSPIGIIGGPPCQGFSNGNVVQSRRDPRNRLPIRYAQLVGEARKRWDIKFFVFENVAGLLQPKHRYRLAKLKSEFRKHGFSITTIIANAFDFGVAQIRHRVLIIGFSVENQSAVYTPFAPPQKRPTGPMTVRDAIGDLPEPIFYRRDIKEGDIPFHPNHWTMQPRSKRFATAEFNQWRSFRRLDWNAPSPTVAYGNREIHVHPSGTRRLSILEAMRLQGFSDSYTILGNFSEQVTQVSNAVPPQVARHVAKFIRGRLDS